MKYLFIILSFFVLQQAVAQPAIKLYGYSQKVTPGIVPAREATDENEQPVRKPVKRIAYFIYLASKNLSLIQPQKIWIGKNCFSVIRTSAVKTPVFSDDPAHKLLVGRTTLKVGQLQLGDTLHLKELPSAVRNLQKQSVLILSYKYNGRTYYTSLKKLVELPPLEGI
jgi:hypothetical protein